MRFLVGMPTTSADVRRFAQLAAALTLTGILVAAVDYLAHAAFDALLDEKSPTP